MAFIAQRFRAPDVSRLAIIAALAGGLAACSADMNRFAELLSPQHRGNQPPIEVTGTVQGAPVGSVQSQPRPIRSANPLPPPPRVHRSSTGATPAPQAALSRPAQCGIHVVAPAETLSSIARLYGKSVQRSPRPITSSPTHGADRAAVDYSRRRPSRHQKRDDADRSEEAGAGRQADRRGHRCAEAGSACGAEHASRFRCSDGADRHRTSRQPSSRCGCGGFEGQSGDRYRRGSHIPLAGTRPCDRGLRREAERPSQRRYQSRGAGGHFRQGCRGRRRRLLGQ